MKKYLSISLLLLLLTACSQSKTENYLSKGSISFDYPKEVCYDYGDQECYQIQIKETDSEITIFASENIQMPIYQANGIGSISDIDKFLQETLQNELCKVDIENTQINKGELVHQIFLDPGCSLYGPDYGQYAIENPEAKTLNGKITARWWPESNAFFVYQIGAGGGKIFPDNIDEEIAESIVFVRKK